MNTLVQKLLLDAGPELGAAVPAQLVVECCNSVDVQKLCTNILNRRNGFLAYDDALHVFPACAPSSGPNLVQWNSPLGWRNAYGRLLDGYLCFAQDVFGNQFAMNDGVVYRVECETGEMKKIAEGLENWVQWVLDDVDFTTGRPFARLWKEEHSDWSSSGERLVPKLPFVLGGGFDTSNFYSYDAEKAMKAYGDLALQLQDVPDGSLVSYQAEGTGHAKP